MEPATPETTTTTPETPQTPKNNHWITTLSVAIFILLSLSAVAFLYFQNQQLKSMLASYQTTPSPAPTATSDPTANWKEFTHPTQNYLFKYPPEWSVTVNQSAKSGTLFGPNSDTKTGLGGVEVREIEIDPKNFNAITESKIVSQSQITINDIAGYKTMYSNVLDGTNFVFKHIDSLIYNIYINSSDVENLKIFDQILSTFKFISPDTSLSASPVACTMEAKICPNGSYVGRTGPNCEFAPCPTP